MPPEVISMHAAHIDNVILLEYITSKVALEEPEIGSTAPKIQTDNNYMDGKQRFGMPGDHEDYESEGDKIDESDAMPINGERQLAANDLVRVEPETSDFEGYDGDDGDRRDADQKEEVSQADDCAMQNLEDRRYSTTD
jgi:hypothetical protein